MEWRRINEFYECVFCNVEELLKKCSGFKNFENHFLTAQFLKPSSTLSNTEAYDLKLLRKLIMNY